MAAFSVAVPKNVGVGLSVGGNVDPNEGCPRIPNRIGSYESIGK